MSIPVVSLVKGREKLPIRHHPWVFSGAVDAQCKYPSEPGVVRIEDSSGCFIAYGWYDSGSHIALRLLSWKFDTVPDDNWWKSMVVSSIRRRRRIILSDHSKTTAWRLVHGEADGLPGLVIDLYHDVVLCTISASVAWKFKGATLEALSLILKPSLVVVETDRSFRMLENLPSEVEWHRSAGSSSVTESEKIVWFKEHGLWYSISPGLGQKTGFYLDQRENRLRVAAYATGSRMLDAFCYTGGFSFNALRSGALDIVAVDSSLQALESYGENRNYNVNNGSLDASSCSKIHTEKANAFEYLRYVQEGRFDIIVLDPPKLAKAQSDIDAASRAYKDLNRLAISKVATHGIIATFSCSGAISRDHFRTVLAWAAHESGRTVCILETLGQPADHPVRLSFPESEYLKGYIIGVE